jgi:hypothetical protein
LDLRKISQRAGKNADMFFPSILATLSRAGSAAPAPAAAAEEDDEDVDLFGSDDEEVDEEAEKIKQQRLAEYAAKKANKPKTIAKSMCTLDVCFLFLHVSQALQLDQTQQMSCLFTIFFVTSSTFMYIGQALG